MDRWLNKVAVVTGASSGIGRAIAKAMVEKGVKVVGLARRGHKMEELQKVCRNFYPIRCDLGDENEITNAFECIRQNLGGVDILINNAGIIINESILGGSTESYRKILDINTVAVAICTKKAVESMKERNTFGHIINVNSVLGHSVAIKNNTLSFYMPSKYALRAMSEIFQHEIHEQKLNIKVTNLSPGMVKTEILETVKKEHLYEKHPHMLPEDIADAVLYILSTPPNVVISELKIEPLGAVNFVE